MPPDSVDSIIKVCRETNGIQGEVQGGLGFIYPGTKWCGPGTFRHSNTFHSSVATRDSRLVHISKYRWISRANGRRTCKKIICSKDDKQTDILRKVLIANWLPDTRTFSNSELMSDVRCSCRLKLEPHICVLDKCKTSQQMTWYPFNGHSRAVSTAQN